MNLGQVLDMWYRNLPTTYIPGSPLRLLVPFEDPRYPPVRTGGEDYGTTELGDRYAMVISCSEISHEDRSFVARVRTRARVEGEGKKRARVEGEARGAGEPQIRLTWRP